MVFRLSFLLLLVHFSTLAQFRFEYINNNAIDSSGHFALYNDNRARITPWKKADEWILKPFSDRIFFRQGRYWGACDFEFNTIVKPEFSKIYILNNQLFAEQNQTLFAFSELGDTLFTLENFLNIEVHTHPTQFRDIQMTSASDRSYLDYQQYIIRTKTGCGVLNGNFEWLAEPHYDNAFSMDEIIYIRNGNKFGFVSQDNKIVAPTWSAIGTFNKWIIETWNDQKERTYFLKSGAKIPHSDSTLVYDYIFKTLKIYVNGKAQLLDFELKPLRPYSGDDIFQLTEKADIEDNMTNSKFLSNQTFFAFKRNGKIGVINASGKEIIPPQYEDVQYLGKDRFKVMVDGKYGVVNYSNQLIAPFRFTHIERKDKYLKVFAFDSAGVLRLDGSVLVPLEFDDIEITLYGFLTSKRERHGFYTIAGELVLNPEMGLFRSTPFGIELLNPKGGKCLVNEKGLLTPLNCEMIQASDHFIKYYLKNQIVMHHLKDGNRIDTTAYPYTKSIQVKRLEERKSYSSVGSSNYAIHQSQLNGKFGSIKLRDVGYAIPPIFDNCMPIAGQYYGHVKTDHTMKICGVYVSLKEEIYKLWNGQNIISNPQHGVIPITDQFTPNSSENQTVVTQEDEWCFDNQFNPKTSRYVYIKPQYLGTLMALKNGELNFLEGQDLMPFRVFYEDLNKGHNLMIQAIPEFDRLEQSAMIKVKNGDWNFYDIVDYKRRLVSQTSNFQYFQSGNILIKNEQGLYDLYKLRKTEVLLKNQIEIRPIDIDITTYFLVKEPFKTVENNTVYKWNAYTATGRKLLREPVDSVEVLDLNAFKIYQNDTITAVDSLGQVYRSYTY